MHRLRLCLLAIAGGLIGLILASDPRITAPLVAGMAARASSEAGTRVSGGGRARGLKQIQHASTQGRLLVKTATETRKHDSTISWVGTNGVRSAGIVRSLPRSSVPIRRANGVLSSGN